MNKKIIIGICILILLAITVSAADIAKFNELKNKLYSDTIQTNEKATLRGIAYSIVDDEMSLRIGKLDFTKEEGVRQALEYKQELVNLNMLFKDAPKTWSILKAKLPGETLISEGKDSKGKSIEGLYTIRTTPESGTTHYLQTNQKLDFKAEIQALEGTIKDIDYCWIAEDMNEKYSGPIYTFSRQIPNPKGGYYTLTLTVLKDSKIICDPNAAIVGKYNWKIQVGGDYNSNTRVVGFIPKETTLTVYTDESITFKVLTENENKNLVFGWSKNGQQIGFNQGAIFLGKCEKNPCTITVTANDGQTPITDGTRTWTINTIDEKQKIPLFPDIPLFPKEEDITLKITKQEGNKVSFKAEITNPLIWKYYEIIKNYEWDFNGDLSYNDKVTQTPETTYDFSNLPKDTYTVRVKVPIVLNKNAKEDIGETELTKHPELTRTHYAQAQEFVREVGTADCDTTNNVEAKNCRCYGQIRTTGTCCKGQYYPSITNTAQCPTTETPTSTTEQTTQQVLVPTTDCKGKPDGTICGTSNRGKCKSEACIDKCEYDMPGRKCLTSTSAQCTTNTADCTTGMCQKGPEYCWNPTKHAEITKQTTPGTPTPPTVGNPQIKDLQSLLKKWKPNTQENGQLDTNTKALITEAVNYYANMPGANALKTITAGGITQQKILQNYNNVKKIVNDYVVIKTI